MKGLEEERAKAEEAARALRDGEGEREELRSRVAELR